MKYQLKNWSNFQEENLLKYQNSSNTLAYMIDDIQEKEFKYNSDLKSPVPHVRSVFPTLLQRYQLNFPNCCKSLFIDIRNLFKKIFQSLHNKNYQKWNSKCFDCFQQLYYNKFKGFLQFDVQNIKKLFEWYQIQ